jgi:H+-translocating NAD(P) transhydrogenase subunit alpha
LLGKAVQESDVVITTAVVPGKKSPVLVTEEMVKGMALGSVIVDLAAERGGNCEITEAGTSVVKHGVNIIGAVNLASTGPYHASMMYARNVTSFLNHLIKDQKLTLNLSDDIVRDTSLARGGEIVNTRVREFFGLPALVASN